MRIIETGKTTIIKLLGKQQLINTKYRMMNYVLRSECEDGILLHNVITGQLIHLTWSEAKIFDHLPSSYNPDLLPLIEMFFLVPIDCDEYRIVHQLRYMMKRLFAPKGINKYLILTTTNCNARCPYCFEYGVRRMDMTAETANQIVDYIVGNNRGGAVQLHWFGGEPLVCLERIDQICRELSKQNIDYKSVMTSNGYLFSNEIVQRAAYYWNLKHVQITLDGTELIYNKIKNYLFADTSPFKTVICNIVYLLEADIHVVLRLNLDGYNGEDLKNLIEYLGNTFKSNKHLSVYVSKIIDEICLIPEKSNTNKLIADLEVEQLNNYIVKMGLSTPGRKLLSLKTNSCMADNDSTIVVLPDGRLSKCESINDGDVIGTINTVYKDNEKINSFKETIEFDYCRNCCLYPACILLKACPTKKTIDPDMCKRSIHIYCKDIIERYNKFRSIDNNGGVDNNKYISNGK